MVEKNKTVSLETVFVWRKEGDSNPRCPLGTSVFETDTFDLSDIFAHSCILSQLFIFCNYTT